MDQSTVIAVDFNRTLVGAGGPDPSQWGPPLPSAKEAMEFLKGKGFTICINSVVGDVDAIKGWLLEHDLSQLVDHINESPAQPEGSSHKLNAVAYIDDRAIPYRGDWRETLRDLFTSGLLEMKKIRKDARVFTREQAEEAVRYWARILGEKFDTQTWGRQYDPPIEDPAQYDQDIIDAYDVLGDEMYDIAEDEYKTKSPNTKRFEGVRNFLRLLASEFRRIDTEINRRERGEQRAFRVRKAKGAEARWYKMRQKSLSIQDKALVEKGLVPGWIKDKLVQLKDSMLSRYGDNDRAKKLFIAALATWPIPIAGWGTLAAFIGAAELERMWPGITRFSFGKAEGAAPIEITEEELAVVTQAASHLNDEQLSQAEVEQRIEQQDVAEVKHMKINDQRAKSFSFDVTRATRELNTIQIGTSKTFIGLGVDRMEKGFLIEGRDPVDINTAATQLSKEINDRLNKMFGEPHALTLKEARQLRGIQKQDRESDTITKVGRFLRYNDETDSAVFVISTPDADRDKDTLNPHGGHYTNYKLNPIVCSNHDTDDLLTTVGVAEDPRTRELKVWVEEIDGKPCVLSEVFFDMGDEYSARVAGKAKRGILRTASVSFLPIEGKVRKNQFGGNHYEEWELVEWSLTTVPANPQAARRLRKLERLAKRWQRRKSAKAVHSELRSLPTDKLGKIYKTFGSGRALSVEKRIDELAKIPQVSTMLFGVSKAPSGSTQGRIMKVKRKLWTLGTKGWLLKSEGESDPELEEYLRERGLDEVDIEDHEPPIEEGYKSEEIEYETEDKGVVPRDQAPPNSWKVGDRVRGPRGEAVLTRVSNDGRHTARTDRGEIITLDLPEQWNLLKSKAEGEEDVPSETVEMANDVESTANEVVEMMSDEPSEEEYSEAINAAMKEEEVPEEMKKAVKAIVLKRFKAKRKKTLKKKITKALYNIYDSGNSMLGQTEALSEGDALAKASEEIGPEATRAVLASDDTDDKSNKSNDSEACPGCGAMPGDGITDSCNHPDGCGYWKEVEQNNKRLKRNKGLKRSKTPIGLEMTRKWIKMIEDDAEMIENAAVLDAAEKALKALEGGMKKAYGGMLEEDSTVEKEEQMAEEVAEEVGAEMEEKADQSVVSAVEQKLEAAGYPKEAMDIPGYLDWNWPRATMADVDKIVQEVKEENGDKSKSEGDEAIERALAKRFGKGKVKKTSKLFKKIKRKVIAGRAAGVIVKRLTKAQAGTVKGAVEFLDDAADDDSTPKRLSAGMKYHSKALKGLTEEPVSTEDPMDAATPEEKEEFEAAIKEMNENSATLERSFFRATGKRLSN